MKLRLVRCCTGPQGTFGILTLNDTPLCNTVEKPWLDNAARKSCIPAGTYHAAEYKSPSKGDVWLLMDVPERSMIEIHVANFESELLGCIAPGQGFFTSNGKTGVSASRITMSALKQKLPPKFTLEIINAF